MGDGHMRGKVATLATLFNLSYLSGNTTGNKFLKVATQLALNDLSGNINVKVSLGAVTLAEKKSFLEKPLFRLVSVCLGLFWPCSRLVAALCRTCGNLYRLVLTRIDTNGHEFLG